MTAPAVATTAAQNTFWRKLRPHVEGLPEHFTPGKYRCPAHDDKGRSLKVDYRDNSVRIHCFSSNCSAQAVMDRIGHRWGDMSDDGPAVGGTLAGMFEYPDERGVPALRAYRYTDPVGVRYQRFTPDGWEFDAIAKQGPQLLYRLPEVLAAMEAEERIFVVDDEQSADELRRHGAVATTAAYRPPGRPWRRDYYEQLHGAYVTVIARKHEAGRKHARSLASLLLDTGAADVQVVEPATAKPGAGVVEHFAAGFGVESFTTLSGVVEGSAAASGVVESTTTLAAIPVALEAGADLLADVEQFLSRYVYWSTPAQAVEATLFAAHTWAFEAAEVSPYQHITSAESDSGKTLLMELLGLLVRQPLTAASMTAAALFRSISIGDTPPTILFDEVQELFGRNVDTDKSELRAVLNAGYKLGGNVRRCVGDGHEVKDFPVFCPKVLTGTGTLPPMLARRSVPILLKRKPKGARVERYRRRVVEPIAAPLRQRLAGWAQTALPVLTDAWPELPGELTDRQQEIWEPLLAIADAAGGDWPKRARAAAVELHGGEVPDESVGVLLLRHIREIFEQHGALERIATRALLDRLVERDDGPWGDWWGNDVDAERLKGPAVKLARLLKPYGIAPKVLRFVEGTERGYERAVFVEPWALYCPEDVTDATAQVRGPFQNVTESEPVTTPKPALTSSVTSVTSESADPRRFAQ